MNKGDLAAHKSADKHITAVSDRTRHGEDLTASRMRPPIAANWRPGYELSHRRGRSVGAFEHDAVSSNKGESST